MGRILCFCKAGVIVGLSRGVEEFVAWIRMDMGRS